MHNALLTFMILTLANDGAGTATEVRTSAQDPSRATFQIALEDLVGRRGGQQPQFRGPLPADAALLRERLGSRRCRELREANFHVRRFELDPGRELADDPIARERVEDILFDGFVKLLRVSVEKAIDLDRRVERLRPKRFRDRGPAAGDSAGNQRGVRVSPNLWIGDDFAYGFKLRPRTAHPIWSRTQLELRQYTGSEALLVRAKYSRGDHLFMLQHRMGDQFSGDSYGLLMRTHF